MNERNDTRQRPTTRSLPIALLRAREKVMGPIRLMLAEAGVTEQQWRVLRVLEENGQMDPSAIARAACLLMPSLTRIMKGLEGKGLITRKPHETDKRTFWVEITDDGRGLIAAHMAESTRIFDEIEAEFGKEKMEQLLDLLGELANTP